MCYYNKYINKIVNLHYIKKIIAHKGAENYNLHINWLNVLNHILFVHIDLLVRCPNNFFFLPLNQFNKK